MCGDCWNAAMGAPAALAAGRFLWVGYRDRLGFVPARLRRPSGEWASPTDALGDDPVAEEETALPTVRGSTTAPPSATTPPVPSAADTSATDREAAAPAETERGPLVGSTR